MSHLKPVKGESQVVYRNKYSYVYSQKVDFGSFSKEYFVTHFGEKAGVLVVKDDTLLLVRQYRLLIDGLSYEIPAGKVDEGEDPKITAIRECEEETGIRCRNLVSLLDFQYSLESVYSPNHLFYTKDFDVVRAFSPSPEEVLAVDWVKIPRCLRMIEDGEIADIFSILALLYYCYKVAEPLKAEKMATQNHCRNYKLRRTGNWK